MTDNHEYETPPQGVTDWHVPLNNNFTKLDQDVTVKDTAANRSTYTAYNNAIYLETDTGKVYIGDGTNWNRFYPKETEREQAYRAGPNVVVETSKVQSAAQAGTAEYGEVSIPLLDGWEIEIIEAGAGDSSPTAPSTAKVLYAPSTTVDDEGTYVEIHSTNDTNAVSTDVNGDPDFTTTLVTHQNNSGTPQRIFFRAINADTVSSEILVWGNWTVIRRPIA